MQAVDSVGQLSSTILSLMMKSRRYRIKAERWLKGTGIKPVSALLYSTLGDMLWISYL